MILEITLKPELPAAVLDDSLPDTLLADLDPLPDATIPLEQIQLPNGQTAAAVLAATAPGSLAATAGEVDAKSELIAHLAMEASLLTMRSLWVAPAEGANAPAQPNGLAFVLGGKRPDVRRASVNGCCPPLYGLDSSGFLHQVFVGAGVALPQGSVGQQRRPDIWNAILAASSYATRQRLEVQDVGPAPEGGFESGDVVYWQDGEGSVRHIGIVFASVGGVSVYTSVGSGGRSGDGACSTAECDKNSGASRGPRSFRLEQITAAFAGVGLEVGGAMRVVGLTPNMVPIAPGTFLMGSGAYATTPGFEWTANELPVHPVTISQPFWMGKYEVTQAEYQGLMGTNPSFFHGENLPVELVQWFHAEAYCDALTVQEAAAGRLPLGYEYRLPTEAEWEYCCRAGTTTEFSFGDSLNCAQANVSGFAYPPFPSSLAGCWGQTRPVGFYPPNAFGLHDMHGNVVEWCLDQVEVNPSYQAGPAVDPYGTSGPHRALRGGSWDEPPFASRAGLRGYTLPQNKYNGGGFRVVCAPIR